MNEIQEEQDKIQKLEAIVKEQAETIAKLQKEVDKTKILGTPDEFETLKSLLESSQWPAAVDPVYICDVNSEQHKIDRAEGIVEIIIDSALNDLKFLDFGCGEGHVINHVLKQNPKFCTGYDIIEHPQWSNWEPNEKVAFTKDWDKVVANGPYDVVLLYDVIDHIVNEDPVDALKKIKSVLTPKSEVFIRCHPWCSRHGTHLYQKLNKAYIHLVFEPNELQALGLTETPCRHIIHPFSAYNDMFKRAGLKLLQKHSLKTEPVDKFFPNTPLVAKRIKSRWKDSHENDLKSGRRWPAIQLEMVFIDYVVGP